jgi:hypothetical protein
MVPPVITTHLYLPPLPLFTGSAADAAEPSATITQAATPRTGAPMARRRRPDWFAADDDEAGGEGEGAWLDGSSNSCGVWLGKRLEAQIKALGRELTDPACMATDHGAGLGARLVPVAHGDGRLLEATRSSAMADALGGLIASGSVSQACACTREDRRWHLVCRRTELICSYASRLCGGSARRQAEHLVALDERRACHLLTGVDQVIGDAHRRGLAPHLLDGALHDVLMKEAE